MDPVLPPVTESQILRSFLLPPSPLPTILPYSAFLNLLPATYRNNSDHSRAIKNIYRNLQFQREITLSQIQENIDRECGAPAASLRADLARRIAIEEGEHEHDYTTSEKTRARKRRRISEDDEEGEIDNSARDSDGQEEDEDDESDISDFSSEDEKQNDTIHILNASQAFHNDPSTLHPAAHVLPLPPDQQQRLLATQAQSQYHTKESLQEAMQNASHSLTRELADLEAEIERTKSRIKNAVGELSDLQYGKKRRLDRDSVGAGAGAGAEEGESIPGTNGGAFADILDALAQFRQAVNEKP